MLSLVTFSSGYFPAVKSFARVSRAGFIGPYGTFQEFPAVHIQFPFISYIRSFYQVKAKSSIKNKSVTVVFLLVADLNPPPLVVDPERLYRSGEK
jgi:hypothetical protein